MVTRSGCILFLVLVGCQDHSVKSFNSAPTATITSHSDGDELAAGSEVELRGAVSDPDDPTDSLLATWRMDETTVCADLTPDGAGVTSCTVIFESAETQVTLEVRDPGDATGSHKVSVFACSDMWYHDDDGDGFGDPEDGVLGCEQPNDYVVNSSDCDDDNDDISPVAFELCDDGIDNNCDGQVDESCLGTNCFEDDDVVDPLNYFMTIGQLLETDEVDDAGAIRDDWEFEADSGTELAVHAWSDDVDTRVELYDPDCELYDSASTGARDTNAFLSFRIPSDGIWTLVVTTDEPAELGKYVLEVLDDSILVGNRCCLQTDTIDLLNEPYSALLTGSLSSGDQLWPDYVGTGFYFDDIEYFAFYGDAITATHRSSDFNAILNLYDPDCLLVGYDTNSGGGTDAMLSVDTERTGIYTLTPWAEYSWSTGNYQLDVSAGW